jgi:hypothetical protein
MIFALKATMYTIIKIISLFLCINLLWLGCSQKAEQNEKKNVALVAQKVPEPVYDRYWNDVARFLAGLPPLEGSVLDSVDNLPSSIAHRDLMDKAWQKKKTTFLDSLTSWVKAEMPEVHLLNRTLFYPFSGPDFVTAFTICPNASRYVFFGLEDEGILPDIRKMPKDRIPVNLANIQKSLEDVMNLSFFVTRAMINQLRGKEFNGSTPLLMLLMARCGNEVLEVKPIRLVKGGKKIYLSRADSIKQLPGDSIVTGVEIAFRKKKGDPVQKLEYYSFDAQDIHLKYRQEDLLAYFARLKPTTTYIKSASYLMHYLTYTMIRNTVFTASDFILQDDSGIGLRYFDKDIWKLTFYGVYNGPIHIFRDQYQRDLYQAYRKDTNIKSLPFGIGYKSAKGTSNLMIARRIGAEAKSTI